MAACRLPILPPRDPLPAGDYRRQARQLRARLGDRPAQLYHSLRALADRCDLASHNDRPPPREPASTFAAYVRQRLRGPILRYSERIQLLHTAREHGLDPFEANLIIAAIVHRCASGDVAIAPAARPLLPAVVVFLLVQSLIVACVLFGATLLRAQ